MARPREAEGRPPRKGKPSAKPDNADVKPNGATAAAEARLPVIKVFSGSLAHNRVEAEAALALHGMEAPLKGVYQRGGTLMRVHRIKAAEATDPWGVQRQLGAPIITLAEPGFLHCHLAGVAAWVKHDGRAKRDVLVNPPKDVVRPLLDGPWEVIAPLTGLLEAPAVLPDGRLLQGSGYDLETGLLLETITIPPIVPSRAAAETALKLVLEVFKDFPYVAEVDRSVAVSGVLSGFAAPVIDATPAHGYSATVAGSGKTLQAEATGLIATGRLPAATPQASSREEDLKQLLSILLKGDAMVLVDNITRPVESDALCAIITGASYEARLLGVSRMVRVPARTLWLLTGNNLTIVGDLVRRTLRAHIDPQCERPDARRFEINLHELIPRRRVELVHACLTILASYVHAGRPKPLPPYGSFEAWSRLVREPLVWLGMADPCASRERLEALDPERELLGTLMDAWARCFGDKPKTIKEVITEADTSTRPEGRDLKEAVANAVVERSGRATPGQNLGFYLASKVDRVHRGRRFKRLAPDKHANAARWKLEPC
jgi:hypothetical protein